MPRALRCCLISAAVLLFCIFSLALQRERPLGGNGSHVLAAEGELTWYRGNIHAHSLWSDGDDYLEMIALWYREHGYNFLCVTDHNLLQVGDDKWRDMLKTKGGKRAFEKLKERFPTGWVDERTVKNDKGEERSEVRLKTFEEVSKLADVPGKFLMIQGEEISSFYRSRPVHMNATNLAEPITPIFKGSTAYDVIQANADAVNEQRARTGQPILVHLNHPNFQWGITAEDLMRVRGENFFEVYNGHPSVHNSGDTERASNERIWDIILTRRLAELNLPIMYGLATDDGHSYHDIPSRGSEPGRGWVMVLASKLAPGTLIEALERGEFYATSGVSLSKISTSDKGMNFEIQPEPGVNYTIEFVGTRKGYDPTSQPVYSAKGEELVTTQKYSADIGTVLKTVSGTKADYQFKGDELYVRARIKSSKKHPNPSEIGDFECAWVQPLRGPAAPTAK